MRQFYSWIGILFVLDQFTKWLVLRYFDLGESLALIPNVLHFTYVQNRGAAFGILQGQKWLFIVLSLVVLGWILISYWQEQPTQKRVYWGGLLVAAGALGNLVDRARFGYVIDFIDFQIWPVFNVADSAITIGVCLLIWASMQSETSQEK